MVYFGKVLLEVTTHSAHTCDFKHKIAVWHVLCIIRVNVVQLALDTRVELFSQSSALWRDI